MDNRKIELVGASCGAHGPYTFYKAFKYNKSGKQYILALNEFVFIKIWSDSDFVSIGELQQLWVDKNSEQTLASIRLYILPENTPEGRTDIHGEHEVLAISERVVIRCEDLLTWLAEDATWSWGLPAVWDRDCSGAKSTPPTTTRLQGLSDTCLDFTDVEEEKLKLDPSSWEENCGVIVLSFPRYCRYRALLKRLEGVHNKWLRNPVITSLGGFSVPNRDTRVLFCKETFDYPDLEGHELLCNHLAPKINLRSKKKLRKQATSPGESESNESESSLSTISSSTKDKKSSRGRNGLHYDLSHHTNRRIKSQSHDEKMFLDRLHRFMNDRQTPIGKVPFIGFKEMDLFKFFSKVQGYGGYDGVTSNRLWKIVSDEMGADSTNSSIATCSRRHYERLLLPYERKLRADALKYRSCFKQEFDRWDDGLSQPSSSDRDASDTERRRKIVLEGKISSLRSVRLKSEKPSDLSGKENIPLSNMFCFTELEDPSRSTHSPEVIVLDSETETPIKNVTTPIVPAFKKRKLDMLKEGGLEVTPIASPGSSSSNPDGRGSLKQSPSPETPPGQVSIMVTPDLSHMLGSPKTGSPETSPASSEPFNSTPTHPRTVINVQDLKHTSLLQMYTNIGPSRSGRQGAQPPRVTQSRSIYAHSESTVYGNPKECFTSSDSAVNSKPPPPRTQSTPICAPSTKSSCGSSSSSSTITTTAISSTTTNVTAAATTTCPPNPTTATSTTNNSSSLNSTGNGIEVLDLRMKGEKPPIEIVRVPNVNLPSAPLPRQPPIRSKVPPPLPVSVGRTTVGSNLEITLVQNPKLAIAKMQQEQRNVLLQQRRVAQQQAKSSTPLHRPSSRTENGRPPSSSASSPTSHRSRGPAGNGSSSPAGLVIPTPPYMMGGGSSSSSSNSSNSSTGSKRRGSNDQRSRPSSSTPTSNSPAAPFLAGTAAASLFPSLLQNLPSSGSSSGKSAYLPQLDLMYYQALCNSSGLYGPTGASGGYVNPLQMATPLYMPSEEHFQLYKNILNQQLKSNPPQANEDLARLLQDGSTSITLVGNSKTPTSK